VSLALVHAERLVLQLPENSVTDDAPWLLIRHRKVYFNTHSQAYSYTLHRKNAYTIYLRDVQHTNFMLVCCGKSTVEISIFPYL